MNNFRVTAQVWFLTLLLVLTEQAAHNHARKVMMTSLVMTSYLHITHYPSLRRKAGRENLTEPSVPATITTVTARTIITPSITRPSSALERRLRSSTSWSLKKRREGWASC